MLDNLIGQSVSDSATPAPRRTAPQDAATAAPEDARSVTVSWLHRGISLAAVMGLVVGMRTFWNGHALAHPGLAFALTCCYLLMLGAAVLALCLSSGRSLAKLDGAVLAVAIAIKVVGAWPNLVGDRALIVDEGMLMDGATRALAAGHNPYLATWEGIDPNLPTQLMDGRTVFDFGYPPFGAMLGAVVQRLIPSVPGIVVLAWLALFATAIMIFWAAPVPLRPLSTLGLLGLGTLTIYANNAYPSLIALPFLCLAAWRWTAIGRGGRLGRNGTVQAIALGLACSTHQLGWFLALFLVVGLAVLRLGELPLRTTTAVLFRYGATALAAFFLVSAPFLIAAPEAWLTGIFEPLLQHAVPHGQGLSGLTHYVIGGSGALDYYGRASMLLLAALLIAFAVHLRTIGPAAVVLPWLVFMVSTRSQDGYWVLTMPLWIVAVCTTPRSDFAGAFRFRLPERIRAALPAGSLRPLGILATVALFLPTVACVGVAVATRQPLDMYVSAPVSPGQTVRTLTVEVRNRSTGELTPHFAVTTDVTIAEFWIIQRGPSVLAPSTSATYTLVPPAKTWKAPKEAPAVLRAVSDRPQTLSSVRLLG
ncbi:hypothetical protein Asp14428_56150 [Actinoplanes sp. NBRC 14428]|nr:hypothetical protein Asp14428_56150 [Actinoplanes sp. NBRC 14428]